MIRTERNVMEIFEARRLELNMSIETLGKMVYPNDASPCMKIQNLRKPRRLSLGDFIASVVVFCLEV